MQIKINGKIYDFSDGESILDVSRRNGIKIPTLCHHREIALPEGLCRLCLVKTDRHNNLVASCQILCDHTMEVVTEDEEIEKARRFNLELLWADHAGKCATCLRNKKCELQNLARDYRLDVNDFVPPLEKFEKEQQLKALKEALKNRVVDEGNTAIFRDSQYCVECRRCVNVCKNFQLVGEFGMNFRSIKTSVGTAMLRPMDCIFCGQCAVLCPTAAITEKDQMKEFELFLKDEDKIKIVLVDPALVAALPEMAVAFFKDNSWEKTAGILKYFGADYVVEASLGNSLALDLAEKELVKKLKNIFEQKDYQFSALVSSSCPAWEKYCFKYWKENPPVLVDGSNPQELLGCHLKDKICEEKKINRENISVALLTACTAKKIIGQNQKTRGVDLAISSREWGRFLEKHAHNFSEKAALPDVKYLDGLKSERKCSFLGGEMVALLDRLGKKFELIQDRVGEKFEDEIKQVVCEISPRKNNELKESFIFAAVAGIANARSLIEKARKSKKKYLFIEVMACPGGCVGGGGQPYFGDAATRAKRAGNLNAS